MFVLSIYCETPETRIYPFQVDSPPLPLPPLPDNERTEVLTAPQEKE